MVTVDFPESNFMLARAVAIRGFGGRRAGELLVIDESGAFRGSLFGGAADEEISERSAVAARSGNPFDFFTVGVGDREAVAAGLACGGEADVLMTSRRSFPADFVEKLSTREPTALATVVSGDHKGLMLVVGFDQTVSGVPGKLLGDPFIEALSDRLVRAFVRRLPASSLEEFEGEAAYIEIFTPPTHMLILGRSDLSNAIVAQGRLLGWSASVVEEAGQGVEQVRSLGSNDALIVLSHDHDRGIPIISELLKKSSHTYIGGLGSRHTQQVRSERLSELGFSQSQIGTIHGPIGLDLGSKTPEETALAICAEILAHVSRRDARSLKLSSGPING